MSKSPAPADDPFRSAREARGVLDADFQGSPVPMILRHKDVRTAAADVATFSNDAPFRVPIPSEEDVRSVRQLPIETDPPDHGDYRKLLEPFFRRPKEPGMAAKLQALIAELLAAACARDSIELVREFALPLQSRALTYLLNVPESEADEWISWGTLVFRDGGDGGKKGAALESYIHRQFDRAEREPGDDFFSVLAHAEFRGRRLTRDELSGFANLTFAGGRDTIIQTIASVMGYLGGNAAAFEMLRANPQMIQTAAEEFFRFVSPLTHIGRVCPHGADIHGVKVDPGQRASLCWASANRDAAVFEAPDELRLDRRPNPHVAFGSGIHNCLGAMHSRVLTRELLSQLCERVATLEILEAAPHVEREADYERHVGYERLVMRLTARR